MGTSGQIIGGIYPFFSGLEQPLSARETAVLRAWGDWVDRNDIQRECFCV